MWPGQVTVSFSLLPALQRKGSAGHLVHKKYLLNVDEGTSVLEGCHEREAFMAPAWGGWVGAACDLFLAKVPCPLGPSPRPTRPPPAVPPCVRRLSRAGACSRHLMPCFQGLRGGRCAEVQLPWGLNPGAWTPGLPEAQHQPS